MINCPGGICFSIFDGRKVFLATLPGISTSKPLLDDISDFREAGRCYVSWAHLRLALFPLAPLSLVTMGFYM